MRPVRGKRSTIGGWPRQLLCNRHMPDDSTLNAVRNALEAFAGRPVAAGVGEGDGAEVERVRDCRCLGVVVGQWVRTAAVLHERMW